MSEEIISLTKKINKGEIISLTKKGSNGIDEGLNSAIFGAGWQEGLKQEGGLKGLVKGLLGGVTNSTNVDVDASIFCFKGNSYVARCCYKSPVVSINGKTILKSAGDDRTGRDKKTNTDNEQIKINLNKIDTNRIDKMFAVINIFNAENNGQNMSLIKKAYCHIYDDMGEEMCMFNMDENYGNDYALVVGELYFSNGKWEFKAIGESCKQNVDTFAEFIKSKYL